MVKTLQRWACSDDCALLAEACARALDVITEAERMRDIRAIEAYTAMLKATAIACELQFNA